MAEDFLPSGRGLRHPPDTADAPNRGYIWELDTQACE